MVVWLISDQTPAPPGEPRAFKTMGYRHCPPPTVCLLLPGPLQLVQVASLSPAGLGSGMDDRPAGFASWGSYCSLSQQLVDLGQVHPRVSNRKAGWINQNVNEPHFPNCQVSSSVALIHDSCLIKLQLLRGYCPIPITEFKQMKRMQNLISYLVASKSCRDCESALSGAMVHCLT